MCRRRYCTFISLLFRLSILITLSSTTHHEQNVHIRRSARAQITRELILYGAVYDVTSFLPSHPGGSKIFLQLSGTDGTEEY
ncbi:cytochrome b5-like heme/steroid binding domain-containing protein, partial [Listeria monocytogenes]|uniref:cytochrome b5-like heme/steroid binding domain-containing protein n=1 Tax=Listeria monocytogenes TaxID=1639 RepID=UPI0039672AC4